MFPDRIVQFVRVKASELRTNPRNWRRHPEHQREALHALLQEVGFAQALVARRTAQGLVLIDGHLRRDLDPAATVPVLVLDVTEEEADTLLASLDPLAGMAVADEEALMDLLGVAAIPEGALLEHLKSMLGGGVRPGLTDPEAVPPLPAKPKARQGDLWALGVHRLACGDSREGKDLARLMGGALPDVLWTDPPYGVSYVGKTKRALTLANDGADGLDELLARSFSAIDAVLRPGAALYVAHPAGALSVRFGARFVAAGWRLHQTLIWVKDRMVLGHADYHYRHEPVLYGYKPGPGRWGRGHRGWHGGNDQDSVFEIPRPAASREHPTAKPVELIRRCLANSSLPEDRVLDPFAGSGSTVIACQELGRRAFAMELDPAYCEVIIRRWEGFTGERAARVDG